ncbi:3-(3-hydroxy-phenyl)propionate/3-hydroxycinnamic acid hydroxylase [Pigmentiphaga humi]|uniref:3-(3-hydroxy-phenyl)propionate/3-hydroxycinnamic acid hydroxylase n=1 Tax=Pigmentiphaga humi TaxID=2478468 RepID=A0A3P4B3Z2_9BURK|nr:bifunctional 3-(3-hydroxy-phenyl)propionate/3-hydroxycinnamic acid hydroxylase [Pigmentiphaga humi]VCU71014.1 3-(3-hydroxy-phenyl)propionate/3-hydroxycinnamic acid hydroxylase [Pigmentiphaga humi]
MNQTCDVPVLIVGAGPVGATLANLLGVYGVGALLIDRSPAILEYPRAVGLDDEAMRTFQAAGVADAMLKDMIQNVPMRMYGAKKQCFAEILPATREFGWYRRNLFSQPLGEQALRAGLARFPHVAVELGVELTAVEQDAAGVTATLRDAAGAERTVRAAYLLAADGGRSTVREKLLKLPFGGQTHSHKWVVIECDQDPLDAPYTALHCEPARPYVCLKLPYGLRRWEFMLFDGEDEQQVLDPAKVAELLAPHVPDPARLNVIRARVYTHHSRIAGSFVVGRICLAGDAAHLTPPWIGQGLNAGLRDACNLAWKAAWIVQGRLKPEALQSYHAERHAHARAMIDLADKFGAVLSLRNRWLAALRDAFFTSIRGVPVVRDYVLQMKFKPMPRYRDGVVQDSGLAARDQRVGRMFIQPLVEPGGGAPVRLDDALGPGFALLMGAPGQPLPAELAGRLELLSCRLAVAALPRSGPAPGVLPDVPPGMLLLEDTENALHRWLAAAHADWVLLRPDRYVAAAGRRADMIAALERFVAAFVPQAGAARAAEARVPSALEAA